MVGSKDSVRTERVSGFYRTPPMNQRRDGTLSNSSAGKKLLRARRAKQPDVTPSIRSAPHATPSLALTATAAQETLLDLRVRNDSTFSLSLLRTPLSTNPAAFKLRKRMF